MPLRGMIPNRMVWARNFWMILTGQSEGLQHILSQVLKSNKGFGVACSHGFHMELSMALILRQLLLLQSHICTGSQDIGSTECLAKKQNYNNKIMSTALL